MEFWLRKSKKKKRKNKGADINGYSYHIRFS